LDFKKLIIYIQKNRFCPEDLCMGCKEDGATDISAIVEIGKKNFC